ARAARAGRGGVQDRARGPPRVAPRSLPVNPPPDGALAWPVERERWNDEAPATREVDDFCAPAAAPPPTAERAPARAGKEMMMVKELTAALPAGHPALPALLFEQAVLAVAAAEPREALAPLR